MKWDAGRMHRDLPAEGELGCRLLGSIAVSLALLRAVDAVEADAFRVLVVEDFDGVAVNYPDYSSGEVSSYDRCRKRQTACKEADGEV